MKVKGNVAIVTGASGGIGEATARLLTSKGTRVVLASRSRQKLEKLSRLLPHSYVVVTDMTKPADVKNLITKTLVHFGRIDILVNNAGRGYDAPVEFADIKKVQEIFDLDFMGPIVAMQHVIPVMRKHGGGAIVNVSSGTVLMTLPNNGPYSGLKRALAVVSQTARVELAKDKITVSVVYPFMTDTNFEKNTMKTHVMPMAWSAGGKTPPMDQPEHVAKKILEAIETGQAEIYAHDWMKKMIK